MIRRKIRREGGKDKRKGQKVTSRESDLYKPLYVSTFAIKVESLLFWSSLKQVKKDHGFFDGLYMIKCLNKNMGKKIFKAIEMIYFNIISP